MAAIPACRWVGQLGAHSIALNRFGRLVTSKAPSSFEVPAASSASVAFSRQNSILVKANGKFLIDTLAIVRKLEGQGLPSKQAEAITEVLNDNLENASQSFVSKGEMQMNELIQEAKLSKFKSELQSSQGNHFSLLQHETEKLRNDIEKMCSELRTETSKLTNKLDREIHALGAQLEAAKYDVMKYSIGTLISLSAVGLAVVHILM